VFGVMSGRSISELLCFLIESCFDVSRVGMFEFFVLDTCHLMFVLLRKDFAVLDRLNGGMIVVLVDLAVYRGSDVLVTSWLDFFLLDSWCLPLVDSRIVFAMAADKVGDCGFGFVHGDW
jgi:hypothetical protein